MMDRPPDSRIRFRVAINVGDVIVDGTDVHGDGVNVAARLQAACPPGAVCMSRAVREQVRGQLGLEFELLGPLHLKNIVRPVEAFVVRLDTAKVPDDSVTVQARGAHGVLALTEGYTLSGQLERRFTQQEDRRYPQRPEDLVAQFLL